MSPQKWLFSDLPPPCYHLSLIHLTALPHVTGKIMTNYFWEFKYWESHLIMITEVKRDSESFKNQTQQKTANTTKHNIIYSYWISKVCSRIFSIFGIKHCLHEHLELWALLDSQWWCLQRRFRLCHIIVLWLEDGISTLLNTTSH